MLALLAMGSSSFQEKKKCKGFSLSNHNSVPA
jgi:hypothetical protein